jgi:hypothetical protein
VTVAVLLMVLAQALGPASRDGAITGQVVDGTTGKPVSAARVSISGSGIPMVIGPSQIPTVGLLGNSSSPAILTGRDGRFIFHDLPAGSFTITATKGGYTEGAAGRRRPGGASQPVELNDARRSADVQVRVWRNGVIGGTVTDESGEPVVGVQVRVLVRLVIGGRARFAPGIAPSLTDDRGMYRFSNLLPGDYIVVASPPSISSPVRVLRNPGTLTVAGTGRSFEALTTLPGAPAAIQIGDASLSLGRGDAVPPPPAGGRLPIYPPTFHPATLSPGQAGVITVGAGEERTSVDVHLQPVATARVSGIVTAGKPAGMVRLWLIPFGVEDLPSELLAPATVSDSAGAFTFPAVPPGRYSLRGAWQTGSDEAWIDMPITVTGDDVENLHGVLRPGFAIGGRLVFEGATQPPDPATVRVPIVFEPVDGRPGPSLKRALTSFMLRGYAPGPYVVRVPELPIGWTLKSITLAGRDVSESPFELSRDVNDLVITFTDRWSGLGGAVRGPGAADATVLVFAADAQAWTNYGSNPRRLRTARAGATGAFALNSVPPGDYYVVAVPDEQSADWRDPKVLEALVRLAAQVTILEGEHTTIDLTIKDVRQ